ncbi:MAG: 5'/3'-nucleotidase SurE [Planctomycetia bacterium]|nr:5'/3'-nucleotidase SurE [Planctomycetia bacterium]
MITLLTNDDGIFSPGLSAIKQEMEKLGDVYVVAPAAEQSGVSQSMTFRAPLIVKDVFFQNKRWGWAVEGTPTDCIKVGVNAICPRTPDLIISGINWGQNAGTNILYSGTLGAAREGGLRGIPTVALSVEDDEIMPDFTRAAAISRSLIQQILELLQKESDITTPHPVFNINMARESLQEENPQIIFAPMDTTPYGDTLERRVDTFGRYYYWHFPNSRRHRPETMTDMNALGLNRIVITPIQIDMTNYSLLTKMENWALQPEPRCVTEENARNEIPSVNFSMRTQKIRMPENDR